jgi:large subunit ribosomal protein L25
MANKATLKAVPRSETGKNWARKMRATGRIPAVVYGHHEETRMLSVDAHELDLLFSRVHWQNAIIGLEIEGERAGVRALVREVQSHPFRGDVLHVDFQQIHAGEKVNVEIPIRLIGAANAPGVKVGGILMNTISDLEVRCLADRIPEVIEIDVSHLEIGDSIHLREITLPEGVEALIDGERTICSVTPPTVVAAEEPTEEAAATAEPEVIKRGKEEEEEE